MNWYKIIFSQKISDPLPGEDYFSVGHGQYRRKNRPPWHIDVKSTDINQDLAWYYRNGTIYTFDAGKTHTDVEVKENEYKGRYEVRGDKKIVSLLIPTSRRYKEMPNQLIKQLTKKFGNDIIIYLF